jgi:transcriptional regulator with XRE-family HTH domain
MADVGSKIKSLRTQAGLTLRELGRMSGVSHASISRYEKGLTEPPWGVVHRIAVALGVDVSDLAINDASSGYVTNESTLIEWSNMASADQSLSDYACLIILAMPMFADRATWIVSITIESFVDRVSRLDVGKVKSHWQEVLDSQYIERIGTGEWTLRLKFPAK